MCHQLHITPNNAQATFVTIVNELFSDGIKWGRVVALFAFAGALAVQCVQKEMPLLVDQVVDWTVGYIDGHLMSWIVQNGDWVSLYFVGGGLLLHLKNFSIVIRDFFSVDILMIITRL